MRILLVSQWCDPEPTFKAVLFARALQEKGHQVQILTGFPNYPGGKVYPGYRIKAFQREWQQGVEILRVPLYPSHDGSSRKRILNYGSFMVMALLYGLFRVRRSDVIYCYHPPLTAGIAAALLAKLRRIPLVYDVQDLWPDTLGATGMMQNPRLLERIGKLCNWVYRQSAQVVVLSPGFKQRLLERGVPAAKLEVIYNWCDEAQIRLERNPEQGEDWGLSGRFNVVFAGTMGKAQALETVLEAAKLLEGHTEIQFVLVGGGIEVDSLKAQAKRLGLQNVRFLPRLPVDRIGQVLGWADVLLVHLKNDPLFKITIPSKTQAYLSVGKPILMAVGGDADVLLEQAQAGLCCPPEQPEALAQAVLELAAKSFQERQDIGQRGKAYYYNHLSLETGTQHFVRVFEKVVRRYAQARI